MAQSSHGAASPIATPPTDPMDDSFRQQVQRARRMTLDKRVREGFALFEQGRDYIIRRIRESFPDATEDDVDGILRFVLKRCKWWGIT